MVNLLSFRLGPHNLIGAFVPSAVRLIKDFFYLGRSKITWIVFPLAKTKRTLANCNTSNRRKLKMLQASGDEVFHQLTQTGILSFTIFFLKLLHHDEDFSWKGTINFSVFKFDWFVVCDVVAVGSFGVVLFVQRFQTSVHFLKNLIVSFSRLG